MFFLFLCFLTLHKKLRRSTMKFNKFNEAFFWVKVVRVTNSDIQKKHLKRFSNAITLHTVCWASAHKAYTFSYNEIHDHPQIVFTRYEFEYECQTGYSIKVRKLPLITGNTNLPVIILENLNWWKIGKKFSLKTDLGWTAVYIKEAKDANPKAIKTSRE